MPVVMDPETTALGYFSDQFMQEPPLHFPILDVMEFMQDHPLEYMCIPPKTNLSNASKRRPQKMTLKILQIKHDCLKRSQQRHHPWHAWELHDPPDVPSIELVPVVLQSLQLVLQSLQSPQVQPSPQHPHAAFFEFWSILEFWSMVKYIDRG
jgi:hypothetical protein